MGIQYLYDSFLHIFCIKESVDLWSGYIDWILSQAGYDDRGGWV